MACSSVANILMIGLVHKISSHVSTSDTLSILRIIAALILQYSAVESTIVSDGSLEKAKILMAMILTS